MIRDKKYTLLAKSSGKMGIYQSITSEDANWEFLNFQARLMKKGEKWEGYTGDNEYGFILLGGNYSVKTDKGSWKTVNGRKDVFSGIAHTLYLSRHTSFELTAESEWLDIACGWCKTDQDHPACFKTPEEAAVEIRGGDNATRQINSLIQPGFDCQRLISVEVYTPSGNWSSFPAHKHDTRQLDNDGNVLEANLEETYFYKIDKPQGFAIQQVYNDDRSMDEIAVARNNDVVLVPQGYHPVVAGHGYNVYYLNFLTGSDQSLANTDDPNHQWVYDSWKGLDPRIPMVTSDMNDNN
ncbi:MAG: 5-deoxy-glucuronate isomerase [Marinilabiliaceae bacterium]|nr:5-deoxy-glucuronate isomerase [Marinilabiliaceae bacterium]